MWNLKKIILVPTTPWLRIWWLAAKIDNVSWYTRTFYITYNTKIKLSNKTIPSSPTKLEKQWLLDGHFECKISLLIVLSCLNIRLIKVDEIVGDVLYIPFWPAYLGIREATWRGCAALTGLWSAAHICQEKLNLKFGIYLYFCRCMKPSIFVY